MTLAEGTTTVLPAGDDVLVAAHTLMHTKIRPFEPPKSWWQRKRYLGAAAGLAAAALSAALAWPAQSDSPGRQQMPDRLRAPATPLDHMTAPMAGPVPRGLSTRQAPPRTAPEFGTVIMTAIAQHMSANYTHELDIPQGGGVSQSSGRFSYSSEGSTNYDMTVTFLNSATSQDNDAHALVVGNKAYVSGPATVPYSETDISPGANLANAESGASVAQDARWVSSPYNFQELLDNATSFNVSEPSPGSMGLTGEAPTSRLVEGPTGGLFKVMENAPSTEFTITLNNAYLPRRLEMTFIVPVYGPGMPAKAVATYDTWGANQTPIKPPPCGIYGGANSPARMYCDS
jgi:hypothetical protein